MDLQKFFNRFFSSMNPTHNDTLKLSASTAKRYTIPAGTEKILLTSVENILVLFGTSAVTVTIPSNDVLDGTGPLLNPGLIDVPSDITHLSVISAAACNVYVSCWKKGAV